MPKKTRPQYQVVRKLLQEQIKINKTARLLSRLGITLGPLENLNLHEIALDVIGFPSDNGHEFDEHWVRHHNETANVAEKKAIRIDRENLFIRDYLDGDFYSSGFSLEQLDDYIEWLYTKYDEHLLEEAATNSICNQPQSDDDTPLRIAFDAMKKIEPALHSIEQEVLSRNEEALTKEIYWGDVYHEIKPALKNSVGSYCGTAALKSSKCWDTAIGYLESIATNMK